jgi:hypothetical protein
MGEWRSCSTIRDLGTRGGEWSASSPGLVAPVAHCTVDLVGTVGLDAVENRKILACRESNLARPYTD